MPDASTKKLTRLHKQPGLVIEGGIFKFPATYQEEGKVLQPDIALWVEPETEILRAFRLLPPGTGSKEALEALVIAIAEPMQTGPVGIKGSLPGKVRLLDNPELVPAVRKLLEPLGVVVETATSLPVVEGFLEELAESTELDESDEPFHWEVNRDQVTTLYRAADKFIKLAPWNYMPGDPPVRIKLSGEGPLSTFYASVMGNGGMVEGVAFYFSLEDFYATAEAGLELEETELSDDEMNSVLAMMEQMGLPTKGVSREDLAEIVAMEKERMDNRSTAHNSLVFFADPYEDQPDDYREWLAAMGLKYGKKQKVPYFRRVVEGGELHMPDEAETRALSEAIEGLAGFFKDHAKKLKEGYFPVEGLRSTGPNGVEIRFPAPAYDYDQFKALEQEAENPGKFNIYRLVFNREGEYLEEEAQAYTEKLLELFYATPEGKAAKKRRSFGDWAAAALELGISHLGLTPPQMAPFQLRTLLLDIFPSKITASPDAPPEIMRELRAFWQFLEREFHLKNAPGCLKVLSDQTQEMLEDEMNDPANFGPAKALLMQGQAQGYNVDTEEGLMAWIEAVNKGQGQGLILPFAPPPTPGGGKKKSPPKKRK